MKSMVCHPTVDLISDLSIVMDKVRDKDKAVRLALRLIQGHGAINTSREQIADIKTCLESVASGARKDGQLYLEQESFNRLLDSLKIEWAWPAHPLDWNLDDEFEEEDGDGAGGD